jgi:type III restriction enzyme
VIQYIDRELDAFNNDLVKGANIFIEDVVGDDFANLKLSKSTVKEASFELNESGTCEAHLLL